MRWKINTVAFRVLLLLVGLSLYCTYPIRQAAVLEKDPFFIYMESKLVSEEDLALPSNEEKNLKLLRSQVARLSFADRNNLAVLELKDGNLDYAERTLISLVESDPTSRYPLLNLVRLYYLLEEYSIAKSQVSTWVSKHKISYKEFQAHLQILADAHRTEERGMYLEAVSDKPGYELPVWLELSRYFLWKGDLGSSEYYLERILTTMPFHEEALQSMAELMIGGKRWSELVEIGKALHLTPNAKAKAYYYLGKGYYEKAQYKTANEWLGKGPDSEKSRLDYLTLWRDSLLAENPKASLEPLRRYFPKLAEQGYTGTEAEFLPTIHPQGRAILDGMVR